MGSHEREALAGLAEDVGQALILYAERMRAAPSTTEASPSSGTVTRKSTDLPRGEQQKAVLALKGLSEGLTAAEVATAVGQKKPNAYKTLAALVDGGWLEQIPDEEPTRWRLAGKGSL